jgi:hypothetical protein
VLSGSISGGTVPFVVALAALQSVPVRIVGIQISAGTMGARMTLAVALLQLALAAYPDNIIKLEIISILTHTLLEIPCGFKTILVRHTRSGMTS